MDSIVPNSSSPTSFINLSRLRSELADERRYFGTDSVEERAKDANLVRYFAVKQRLNMLTRMVKQCHPRWSRKRWTKLSALRRAREANDLTLGPVLDEKVQDIDRKAYIIVTLISVMPEELLSADASRRNEWLRQRARLLLSRGSLLVQSTGDQVATAA